MKEIDFGRRDFCGGAAVAFAAMPLGIAGTTSSEAAQSAPRRIASAATFGPIKSAQAGVLNVGYVEAGPAGGPAVILLHGWPYDIHSFVEVAPILAGQGYRVIVPYLRGFGDTRFLSADTMRNGEPAAMAQDAIDLMDALRIDRAILGAFDLGGRSANIVASLSPKRVRGLIAVSGYLISSPESNKQPLPPDAEYQWWYQFYFATERGRLGYQKNTRAFNKLTWKLASPQWNFDDATFDRTAASFDNPDHVAVVIHNYRWRLGLAEGEARYADTERTLAVNPPITVPTITMEGDANGAPHPPPEAYRARFTGRYEHRTVRGGIGHNLPQEAPRDFAQAVMDVASRSA